MLCLCDTVSSDCICCRFRVPVERLEVHEVYGSRFFDSQRLKDKDCIANISENDIICLYDVPVVAPPPLPPRQQPPTSTPPPKHMRATMDVDPGTAGPASVVKIEIEDNNSDGDEAVAADGASAAVAGAAVSTPMDVDTNLCTAIEIYGLLCF